MSGWKSTLLLETAFGCFPPRGTDEARLFPKLERSEPEILESEFPTLGISHLPEEPFARVPCFPPAFCREHPAERAGGVGGAAAIPGRREEAGRMPRGC